MRGAEGSQLLRLEQTLEQSQGETRVPLLQCKPLHPFVGARKGRAASQESSLLPDMVLYTSDTSTREAVEGGLLQVLNQHGSTVRLLFQVTKRWEMKKEERKERRQVVGSKCFLQSRACG